MKKRVWKPGRPVKEIRTGRKGRIKVVYTGTLDKPTQPHIVVEWRDGSTTSHQQRDLFLDRTWQERVLQLVERITQW